MARTITRMVRTSPDEQLRGNFRVCLFVSFFVLGLGTMISIGSTWMSEFSDYLTQKSKNKGCLMGALCGTISTLFFWGILIIACITKTFALCFLMILGVAFLIFFNTYTYKHLKFPKCYYMEPQNKPKNMNFHKPCSKCKKGELHLAIKYNKGGPYYVLKCDNPSCIHYSLLPTYLEVEAPEQLEKTYIHFKKE